MYTVLLVLHLISAIALIAIVLLQAGKGGGLSGAFGSGMGSETLFGARTGDVLTRATAVVATVFLSSALFMAYLSTKSGSSVAKEIREKQIEEQDAQEKLRQLQEILKTQAAQEQAEEAADEAGEAVEEAAEETAAEVQTDVKPPLTETPEAPPLLPAEAQ